MSKTGEHEKTELFETMPIPRAVAELSLPTIFGSIVMILYNLADTYFVGMVNDPVQNAAVTLAYPVILSLNAVNNLFGVGSSSMMSRALGVHDMDTARRSSAFGFYCSLCCGIAYSLAAWIFMDALLGVLGAGTDTWDATRQYLKWTIVCGASPAILNVVMGYMVRSEGAAFHASIGTMSGCLLNIVLDPFFILPGWLGMGAAGAGLATFISNCFALMYFLVLMFIKRGRSVVCLDPHMARAGRTIVLGVCTVGIPAAIQNLLNVAGTTVLNNITATYGTAAVAAMGISHKISQVLMMVALGASQGVMPLIGYNYASRNIKRMKEALAFTLKVGLSALAAGAALLFVFARPVIMAFMKDAEVVSYGTSFLRAFSLAVPFLIADFVGVGVYQACGLGVYSLFFALARKVVLEIPLMLLLDRIMPLYGLPYAQAVTEAVLTIAAAIVLLRLFNKLESAERCGKYL